MCKKKNFFFNNNLLKLQYNHQSSAFHSQSEGFIVFGGPAVVLGLGGVLPLLVAEVRPDDVDLDKRAENSLRLPSQVIGCHH